MSTNKRSYKVVSPAKTAATIKDKATSSNETTAVSPCTGMACRGDSQVYLSFYAYPAVVRQVGDVVTWYSKITNLTDKIIVGPIDFYMSGSTEAIATIDELQPNDYFELVVEDIVSEADIALRFIVGTLWARLRTTGCLLGNVVESRVAVDQVTATDGDLQFANISLLVTAGEDTTDVQAGVDIINSLVMDLGVVFGQDTELSYLVDGEASQLFETIGGMLRLSQGAVITPGQRLSLSITNTVKTADLGGLCSQNCNSTASWRFAGGATTTSNLAWAGTNNVIGFSAVLLLNEAVYPPIGLHTIRNWTADQQGGRPDEVYGVYNDGNFNAAAGLYRVPVTGRYRVSAALQVSTTVERADAGVPPVIGIAVDASDISVPKPALIAVTRSAFQYISYTPRDALETFRTQTVGTMMIERTCQLSAGDIVYLLISATNEASQETYYYGNLGTTSKFSMTYLD